MQDQLLVAAAAPTLEIFRGIRADQLDAPTPCGEYEVRKLINHLLFWGPSQQGAADKKSVAPPAASEADVELTDGDWLGKLEALTAEIVRAWSEPAAWEGTTHMGGPMELPASMIGGMVLGEFVVHGWDLARATGQQPTWDDEVLTRVYEEVAKTADQGDGHLRRAVQAPGTAPVLDRILGLTGRNPNWSR